MTTKVCPYCGGDSIVPLISVNQKICNSPGCKRIFDWYLDEGQASVFMNPDPEIDDKLHGRTEKTMTVDQRIESMRKYAQSEKGKARQKFLASKKAPISSGVLIGKTFKGNK